VGQGRLDMYIEKERKHVPLKPGESLTAKVRQLHTFANNSDQPTTMMVETRPAGGVVTAFEIAYGVANAGGAGRDGLPKNPLVRLRFIEISQGFLSGIPLFVQQTVFSVAKIFSRWTGVEKSLNKYVLK
jgi:hypothetical protein